MPNVPFADSDTGLQNLQEIGAPLEVLINNIGIFESKPYTEITDEEWLHYFNVNVVTVARYTSFIPSVATCCANKTTAPTLGWQGFSYPG